MGITDIYEGKKEAVLELLSEVGTVSSVLKEEIMADKREKRNL